MLSTVCPGSACLSGILVGGKCNVVRHGSSIFPLKRVRFRNGHFDTPYGPSTCLGSLCEGCVSIPPRGGQGVRTVCLRPRLVQRRRPWACDHCRVDAYEYDHSCSILRPPRATNTNIQADRGNAPITSFPLSKQPTQEREPTER